MTIRVTLPEPIEILKFWKNRKGEAVVVRLSTYQGFNLIDIRTWFTYKDGVLAPGKGFAVSVRHIPKLMSGIADACTKARELGLLEDDDGGGE